MKVTRIALFFFGLTLAASGAFAEPRIVARVNDGVITTRDVDQEVARMLPSVSFHGNLSAEKTEELRENAMEILITKELQYQDAVRKGVKPDKSIVNEQMTRIRDRFKGKKEFLAALQGAGMTEDDHRKMVEKDVVVSQIIKQTVVDPARQTDAMLKDYYDKNLTKFRQPESVRLRIITTKDLAKAQDALSRIHQGQDFGNVASRLSEDNYRIMGGDLGYIHRGRVLPEIEEVAFRLKPGEVSDLIKADNTFFIVKTEERKAEHQLTFGESKDKLRKELEKRRSDELMTAWMAELKGRAKIEIVSSKGGIGSAQTSSTAK